MDTTGSIWARNSTCPLPTPESSYPLQQEVPNQAGAREIANTREVTRRLRAMSENIVEVIDADEEIVEPRLMRRGGQ